MADLSDFFPLFDKTEADIYAEMAATANAGLQPDDPDWADTRVGSPFWLSQQTTAIALAAAYSRMNEAAAAAILSTSWGDYLDLWAESFGTERKEATSAVGSVTFVGASGTLIGTGVRMAPSQTDPDLDPPSFETTGSGAVPVALAAPSTPTVSGLAGGSLVNGTTYRYVVTAVDAGGGETLPSPEGTFTATSTNKEASIDWPDVAGAVAYRVYRRTGAVAGPPWDLLVQLTVSAHVDGIVAGSPDATQHPPAVATSGTLLALPVRALDEGTAGNVAAGTVTELQTAVPGVSSVSNPLPMAGGAEVESDAALKERLEQRFGGQGGGNKADYARWALEEPGVGRVTVVANWNGDGTVQVIVMDDAGRATGASVVTSLQARLDPIAGQGEGQAPIDHEVTVQTPAVRLIDVAATPTYQPGYSLDGSSGTIALRAQIDASVRAYIDGLAVGDDVIQFQVETAIGKVRGVLSLASAAQIGVHGGALGTTDVAISTNPAQVAASNVVTLS